MKKLTRRFWMGRVALLAFVLPACVSAVDDGSLVPAEEPAESTSEELKAAPTTGTGLELDAGDCAAAPPTSGSFTTAYDEYISIVDTQSLTAAPAGSSCTAACKCCKRGNSFCCKHCDWCSGPIKVSPGVLSR
jgi:hypothetical protein